MINFTPVVPGLEIARGYQADQAVSLRSELEAAVNLEWLEYLDGYKAIRFTGGIIDINQELAGLGLFSANGILELDIVKDHDTVVINQQAANVRQRLHSDDGFEGKIYVWQLSPNGAFNYFDVIRGTTEQIEVSTGDLLRLNNQLVHGGQNIGLSSRYNLVIGKTSSSQYFTSGEE